MNDKQLKKEARKKKIDSAKQFLSNKKNKALVKLGFWLIFFVFVFVYIRLLESRNKKYIDINDTKLPQNITEATKILKDNFNYEFIYKYEIVSDDTEKYVVTGKKNYNKYLINYNNENYYYDDKNFYIITETDKQLLEEDNFIYSLLKFDASNVYNYLLKSNYEYKQEKSDGTITIRSYLKINVFDSSINSDDVIIIDSVEKNNELISINFDLSNYYQQLDDNYSIYKINIIYQNFGSIQNFDYN